MAERMPKTYHVAFMGTEKDEKEFEKMLEKLKTSTTTGVGVYKWVKYLALKGDIYI